VAAFLEGRIRWIRIPDVLEAVLSRHDGGPASTVDDVVDADLRARAVARSVIDERFTE
jgi:1-deoxy-D-xylulose-5-phosphate reductoisomerase